MYKTHSLSVDNRGNTPRLYRIWRNMKGRCLNPKASEFENYGGRNINVCDEWLNYINFHYWAIQNGYSDELTIDRINVNGNYEPSNCRWATRKEQSANKRDNRLITYNGETKTLMQWSEYTGIKYSTLRCRLDLYGWSVEKTLSEPTGKHKNITIQYHGIFKSLIGWANEINIPYKVLHQRLSRGWDLEKAFSQPLREAR